MGALLDDWKFDRSKGHTDMLETITKDVIALFL